MYVLSVKSDFGGGGGSTTSCRSIAVIARLASVPATASLAISFAPSMPPPPVTRIRMINLDPLNVAGRHGATTARMKYIQKCNQRITFDKEVVAGRFLQMILLYHFSNL
jgi:hypothetical protein